MCIGTPTGAKIKSMHSFVSIGSLNQKYFSFFLSHSVFRGTSQKVTKTQGREKNLSLIDVSPSVLCIRIKIYNQISSALLSRLTHYLHQTTYRFFQLRECRISSFVSINIISMKFESTLTTVSFLLEKNFFL